MRCDDGAINHPFSVQLDFPWESISWSVHEGFLIKGTKLKDVKTELYKHGRLPGHL